MDQVWLSLRSDHHHCYGDHGCWSLQKMRMVPDTESCWLQFFQFHNGTFYIDDDEGIQIIENVWNV